MKTANAIYNPQAIAASTGSGKDLHPVGVNLTALTVNQGTLEAIITSPATAPKPGQVITIWYAYSNTDYTGAGADIPKRLRPSAQPVQVVVDPTSNGITVKTTDSITIRAGYIYAWIDHNGLDQAVSLVFRLLT